MRRALVVCLTHEIHSHVKQWKGQSSPFSPIYTLWLSRHFHSSQLLLLYTHRLLVFHCFSRSIKENMMFLLRVRGRIVGGQPSIMKKGSLLDTTAQSYGQGLQLKVSKHIKQEKQIQIKGGWVIEILIATSWQVFYMAFFCLNLLVCFYCKTKGLRFKKAYPMASLILGSITFLFLFSLCIF